MAPTLSSGDLVLINHEKKHIDPQGGIYAVAMDDLIMIKRLQILHGTPKVRIISDNPHYAPIEVDASDIHINGKVIWFCREIER